MRIKPVIAHTNHTILSRLFNLSQRPVSDIWLLVVVFVLLGVTRLVMQRWTYSRLSKIFGYPLRESSCLVPQAQEAEARRVRWAINSISPYTPWRSNCLPRALTAKIILRRKGINTTLYTGASFKTDKPDLQGHVWLTGGSIYVSGGNGAGYGAVVSFAD